MTKKTNPTVMRLGIDFGTTRTVCSVADRGNYPVLGFMDDGGEHVEWFPSVVAVRGPERRYGFEALATADDPSWTRLRSFKRLLTGPAATLDRAVQVAGCEVPVADLLTGFLEALRAAILNHSNLPKATHTPRLEAVIAVPANAHSTQRLSTLAAFRSAGFDVLAMLNEPSAAGFEYTHRYRNTLTSRRDHVVVYDLGGGTFDASLLRMTGRCHEVIATSGLNQLGGDDFDQMLVDLVLGAAKLDAGELDPHELARLHDACREAKESLTANSRRITLDVGESQQTVAVADYYAACSELIRSTMDAMGPVASGLEREDPDVAGLYVVGGASALPAVARALRDRFGRRVHRSPYPFASTAIGLAIAADDVAGYELSDRYSRSLGVFREAFGGREVAFDTIVGPDARLPAKGDAVSTFRRTYRAAHNIGYFRFVECTTIDSGGAPRGDITPLGEVLFPFDTALRDAGPERLRSLAVHRLVGDGPLVEEEYRIDRHGIICLAIRDLDSGYRREYRLPA